jgi:hypothetical protein
MSDSSGNHFATGSASASLPSSIRLNAAATVTGFVIDAMRKIVSRCIGRLAWTSRWPSSLTCSTSPERQTSVTAPASRPASIASRMEASLVSSFIRASVLRGRADPAGVADSRPNSGC